MHVHGLITMVEAAARGTAGLWLDLRSRFILRAFDAVLTARPLHTPGGIALPRRGSNYGRVHLAVRLTNLAVPTAVTWAKGRLHQPQHLPFADRATDVLSFGAGSTVYLVGQRRTDPAGADLVLKVYRKSLGRTSRTLLQQARALRDNYRLICSWYAGSGVTVPTDVLIVQGPLLGHPVVACVQPYIGGEKHDFFELARAGALATLLREHAALLAQFQRFVERTVDVLEAEDRCVDLISRNNLLVVRRGDDVTLQLIDYGVLDLRAQRAKSPERAAAALASIACLRRLYEETFDYADPVGGPALRTG